MKQQNILLYLFGLFTITYGNPIDIDITQLNVEITESHVRNYAQYFNCENPELCRYNCYLALYNCWNNVNDERWHTNNKYSLNDCWNLNYACDTIDTGVVPEYKDYRKKYITYFPMNSIDNEYRNVVGSIIPFEAYRCDMFYDGIDRSYCQSSAINDYFSDCYYESPERMIETIDGYIRAQYCALYNEYDSLSDVYVLGPHKNDIYCYTQYFHFTDPEDPELMDSKSEGYYRLTCSGGRIYVSIYGNNDIGPSECLKNAELCMNMYPAEDCEKLSLVCDAMITNEMPDFVIEQYNSIIGENTEVTETPVSSIEDVTTETVVTVETTSIESITEIETVTETATAIDDVFETTTTIDDATEAATEAVTETATATNDVVETTTTIDDATETATVTNNPVETTTVASKNPVSVLIKLIRKILGKIF